MARMLILDGDACLWNSVCEILESEGYTVCRAHNDYEGLPPISANLPLFPRASHLLHAAFCCLSGQAPARCSSQVRTVDA